MHSDKELRQQMSSENQKQRTPESTGPSEHTTENTWRGIYEFVCDIIIIFCL